MKEKRVGKPRVIELLQKAAAKAAAEGDPWAKYNLPAIPAERIIRHLYHPETQTWTTDESVVKIERTPFTHGAMRHCYRMKKRATPPESATNHRFHKHGWSRALNYIAKAYHKDGEIDTSDEAKRAVQNDVMLQYEAQHWAKKFNENGPPSKILFIRAYVVEFPDREGQPWFAVERYIAGNDWYGLGFVKHNTNAGFVDTELHRVTPQVFSAYSFYASEGTRLVADIQGVGDLYTDPQVLSSDYRFGDGDLGPRGMALFFKTFRHNAISDAAGIPIFPLSKNELRVQAKYEEDEITVSDDERSLESNGILLDRFQLLDLNRMRRSCALKSPRDLLQFEEKDTFKRSNISRDAISDSLRSSMRMFVPPNAHLLRSKSEVTETQSCLDRARKDLAFTHHDFHRHISGELRERQYKRQLKECEFRKTTIVRKVSAPIIPTDRTMENLGKVHYQLAMLHGMGRFPETIPEIVGKSIEGRPEHDGFSVLFHLSYAASLQNSPACLALARVHAGLGTIVSGLLNSIVPIDFEAAKDLLRRAMTSSQLPNAPKAAAGCLLYQLLHDERKVRGEEIPSDNILIRTLKDTIVLIETAEDEQNKVSQHKKRAKKTIVRIHEGDRVEANYCLEGTFYPGDVLHVSDDGQNIAVRYDDDGSEETLVKEQVRLLIPPTATQTSLGGPLSDEEAFGSEQGDDKFLLQKYELQAELAALYETTGEVAAACRLYELAADAAVQNGKMQNATQWSLKAGELEP